MQRTLTIKTAVVITLASALGCSESHTPTHPAGYSAPVGYDGLRRDEVVPSAPIQAEASPAVLHAPPSPDEIRYRVGVTVAVGARVDLSSVDPARIDGVAVDVAHGALRGNGAGGFVWSAVVTSPGATAIRLELADLFLPRNTRLYVYNEAGEAFGPYERRGPHGNGGFWAPTLGGDTAWLQIRYDGADTARALGAIRVVVENVGHLDERFPLGGPPALHAGSNLCEANAACVENATCSTIPANVRYVQDAVARILFASGAWQYLCSGALVADTDAGSEIPLFLTANHCVSKAGEASSLEAWFRYQSSDCTATCTGAADSGRTLGSTILSTSRSGDYTLLRLSEQPPAEATFLVWDAVPVAHAHGTMLYRISHPRGAPQAYSEHMVDTGASTCRSWPRGAWIYSEDVFGATEGGSSGSPVVDADGELVGQLSGACGYNVGDVCDAASNATVDGALAAYYTGVAEWLDPSTGCTDADADGYCAPEDCDDSNPGVSPAATEVCDNGVDDDCNGAVDADDPVCGTGGCDLLPRGSPCAADSECCSNKCRGSARDRRCR